MIPQTTRAYIYRVLTALGPLAIFYGLAASDEVALWSGVVAALFVLPAVNTPTKSPDE